MKKYYLAKLVQIAGGIETRKRVQKLIYLLQAAGCQFDAEFYLHRFGPYSQDVANAIDDLVNRGILEETQGSNGVGIQYRYELTAEGEEQLIDVEKRRSEKGIEDNIAQFAKLARELAKEDLRELEVASTVAYYNRDSGLDWPAAAEQAYAFKQVAPSSAFAAKCLDMAMRIVKHQS